MAVTIPVRQATLQSRLGVHALRSANSAMSQLILCRSICGEYLFLNSHVRSTPPTDRSSHYEEGREMDSATTSSVPNWLWLNPFRVRHLGSARPCGACDHYLVINLARNENRPPDLAEHFQAADS